MVALVHDLGQPACFLNMLRVVKIGSPMNVGSWLAGGYVPAAGAAAASALTGRGPRLRGRPPRVPSYSGRPLLPTPR